MACECSCWLKEADYPVDMCILLFKSNFPAPHVSSHDFGVSGVGVIWSAEASNRFRCWSQSAQKGEMWVYAFENLCFKTTVLPLIYFNNILFDVRCSKNWPFEKISFKPFKNDGSIGGLFCWVFAHSYAQDGDKTEAVAIFIEFEM